MNRKTTELIGNWLGKFVTIDADEDGFTGGYYCPSHGGIMGKVTYNEDQELDLNLQNPNGNKVMNVTGHMELSTDTLNAKMNLDGNSTNGLQCQEVQNTALQEIKNGSRERGRQSGKKTRWIANDALMTSSNGLISWSKVSFGNLRKKSESCRQRFQNQCNVQVTDNILVEIGKIEEELEQLLDQEDLLWRQRSRLITDNVLVVYELNHFIRSKSWGKKGIMSVKLDMSKAYDRVEWVVLARAMEALANENEANTIMQILDLYERASGSTKDPVSLAFFVVQYLKEFDDARAGQERNLVSCTSHDQWHPCEDGRSCIKFAPYFLLGECKDDDS
ncbi:hypothetical protein ACH5RR_006603 [Cinchona calisaya]|uniref:Reverse transcriptase n=1 Tax=Cinchona calisaya TaxID=153742 RepID=A0ABD3APR7_9GENT